MPGLVLRQFVLAGLARPGARTGSPVDDPIVAALAAAWMRHSAVAMGSLVASARLIANLARMVVLAVGVRAVLRTLCI